ncbi:MAG: phosphopantetheine-binding protein [Opitutales bacterium]
MEVSPQPRKVSEEEEGDLRDQLKRCPPETIDAALAFRREGRAELVPTIIMGIIERYLEPEVRPRLKEGGPNLRFLEDLGIDSLTMVEVVMLIEQTLDITIENDELKDLRTVGDAQAFIDAKLKGLPAPEKAVNLDVGEIVETLPQGHPFLFLQDASLRAEEAKGTYKIAGDEFFLEGHFKHQPVFPASIMMEAVGQLAVLHLLHDPGKILDESVDSTKVYFKSAEGLRCSRICGPGDILTLNVKQRAVRHPAATYQGNIVCGIEKVATIEELVLTFDYASKPSENGTTPCGTPGTNGSHPA